jgi:Ca2+-transporting ATPase
MKSIGLSGLPHPPSSTTNRQMTLPAYATATQPVLEALSSSEHAGLTTSQVTRARELIGWNELAAVAPEPQWKRFLAQFSDLVVWILIAAALISGAMGEWTDTAAILAIVLLNAILGYFQEEKAEQALAALRSLAAPTAKVIRDGTLASIPARNSFRETSSKLKRETMSPRTCDY